MHNPNPRQHVPGGGLSQVLLPSAPWPLDPCRRSGFPSLMSWPLNPSTEDPDLDPVKPENGFLG